MGVCVWDEYGVQAIYITIKCVCVCAHVCTFMHMYDL